MCGQCGLCILFLFFVFSFFVAIVGTVDYLSDKGTVMKLKKILILLLLVILVGCSGKVEKIEENEKVEKMDRAVFAWEGVDDEGLDVIQKYGINTILLDYNHLSDLSTLSSSNRPILASYNIFILAGSPEWGVAEMTKVVEEAEKLKADGVVFDIESGYEELVTNLEKLDTDFPVYVCIPFWLDSLEAGEELVGDKSGKEIVERIIKATDGVFVLNYYKGEEGKQTNTEEGLAQQYKKKIWTVYELQPVGVYGLEEYNTYYSEGIEAVEENYKEQFSGTDVGIAFHNLEMMKELDK